MASSVNRSVNEFLMMRCKIRVQVCRSVTDWSDQCTDQASVFLPVLSAEFYSSPHMNQLVRKAHELRMRMLPVRRCLPDWKVQQLDPFICRWIVSDGKHRHSIVVCSCFARANQIPSNEDWIGSGDNGSHADHIDELAATIRMHVRTDRREYALMLGRIPKYVLTHACLLLG